MTSRVLAPSFDAHEDTGEEHRNRRDDEHDSVDIHWSSFIHGITWN